MIYTSEIIIQREKLIQFCKQHSIIYLYGAGTYGKRYYEYLKSENIEIEAFVVSKLRGTNTYCGKLIYAIDEIKGAINKDVGIIPAFENADIPSIKRLFEGYIKPGILEIDNMLFLLMITNNRFAHITDEWKNTYGEAYEVNKKLDFKEILVIRIDAIGDLICTTPFLRELKRNYPESKISVVIRESNRLILRNSPYIDELLFYDSELISGEMYEQCEQYDSTEKRVKEFTSKHFGGKKFDAVFLPRELMAGRNIIDEMLIALESGAKYRIGHVVNTDIMKEYVYNQMNGLFSMIVYTDKAHHEVTYQLDMLRKIGCCVDDEKMELWISDDVNSHTKQLLESKGLLKNEILIAVGFVASVSTRTWKSENYKNLFEMINGRYGEEIKFLILGGKDAAIEYNQSNILADNVINLSGKTTLEETAAVISQCDMYIGSNTGLLHFASAFGKPSVTIYAELDDGLDTDGDSPVKMGAWKTENIALVPHAGLDGCHRVCRMGQSHCINLIKPEQVLDSIEKIINT